MFRIVFVCTGNRCRSPFAEAYVKTRVRDLPVEVESVGTLDIEGGGVPDPLVELAHAAGFDIGEHRARTLGRVVPDRVDLCLGLAREHVAAAVVEGGFPRSRTFTLAEFIRLAELVEIEPDDDPVRRARAVVQAADERRAAKDDFVAAEDVADPMGGPRSGYQAMVERVVELGDRLVAALFDLEPETKTDERLPLDLQVK